MLRCVAQGHDLSVRGWIMPHDWLVVASADDDAVHDHHGTDGNLARNGGTPRQQHRFAHLAGISFERVDNTHCNSNAIAFSDAFLTRTFELNLTFLLFARAAPTHARFVP